MTLDRETLNGLERAIDALQQIDSVDYRDNDYLADALDELYKIRTAILRGPNLGV